MARTINLRAIEFIIAVVTNILKPREVPKFSYMLTVVMFTGEVMDIYAYDLKILMTIAPMTRRNISQRLHVLNLPAVTEAVVFYCVPAVIACALTVLHVARYLLSAIQHIPGAMRALPIVPKPRQMKKSNQS